VPPKSNEVRIVKTGAPLDLKVSDSGIVEGIANVFGVVDAYDDIVTNGAFAKTLAERGSKVRVLDAHSTGSVTDVIGIVLDIHEVERQNLPQATLDESPEASGGLYVKVQFLLDTERGREVFARLKAGASWEWSIGFNIIRDEWSEVLWRGEKKIVRIIKEIRLWEISPVVFGASPGTTVTGVKSLADDLSAKDLNSIVAGYKSAVLALQSLGQMLQRAGLLPDASLSDDGADEDNETAPEPLPTQDDETASEGADESAAESNATDEQPAGPVIEPPTDGDVAALSADLQRLLGAIDGELTCP
jgi:uncharacterized protein